MLVMILAAIVLVLFACGLVLRAMSRKRLAFDLFEEAMRLSTAAFCALALSAVMFGLILVRSGDFFSLFMLPVCGVLAFYEFRFLDLLHEVLDCIVTIEIEPDPGPAEKKEETK